MPIISKETWEKIPRTERKKIIDGFNPDKNLDNEYAEGYYNAMRDIFGEDKLKPTPLTYEDVARELFEGKRYYRPNGCMDNRAYEEVPKHDYQLYSGINCVTDNQGGKIIAINKLLNVAKFLNKDWKPDWFGMKEDEKVWIIGLDNGRIIPSFILKKYSHSDIAYFRTEELAIQAIEILGEDTVRLALTTEY